MKKDNMEIYEVDQTGPDQVESFEIAYKSKHLCWIYASEDDRLGIVEPFIIASLTRRKQCMLVVPEKVSDLILDKLKKRDLNIERYLNTGQIMTMDPEEYFFTAGELDIDAVAKKLKEALALARQKAWQGLAIVVDASELLGRAKDEDWLGLEFRADHECRTEPCVVLCLYDQHLISGAFLASMIKTHPVIGLGGSLARNPFYVTPTAQTS